MEKDLDYYKGWYTLRDGDFFPERVEDVLKRARGNKDVYLCLLIDAGNIFHTRQEALWASKQISAFLSDIQRQSSTKTQLLQVPIACRVKEPQELSSQQPSCSANTREHKQQTAPYRMDSKTQEHCLGTLSISSIIITF